MPKRKKDKKFDYFSTEPVTNPCRALYLLTTHLMDGTKRWLDTNGTGKPIILIHRFHAGQARNELSKIEAYLVDPGVVQWLIDMGYVERERSVEHDMQHVATYRYVITPRGIQYLPPLDEYERGKWVYIENAETKREN